MKGIKFGSVISFCILISGTFTLAQNKSIPKSDSGIYKLIDLYSQAREKQDTILLKSILTPDIDQLVSTGEWRHGLSSAIKGMLRSTASKSGKSTISVDKIKYIGSSVAVVDTRYDVPNPDGTIRKMWSCFVVVKNRNNWKISSIRNMMPTGQN